MKAKSRRIAKRVVQPSAPATSALRPRKTGSHDAVETAIDLAKSDRLLTWEEQLAQNPERVTRWEGIAKPKMSQTLAR